MGFHNGSWVTELGNWGNDLCVGNVFMILYSYVV